ncbi:MAG: prepilin-type N-terminal cleavage/methylation domain-containing protein, partial [Bdellovibrionales bacterium]|nr:prepilin-type N-terminal cleavage/methylation domain-containing protein [Bdellovibrionales bacterium]
MQKSKGFGLIEVMVAIA